MNSNQHTNVMNINFLPPKNAERNAHKNGGGGDAKENIGGSDGDGGGA
jgi:hypothetical protein